MGMYDRTLAQWPVAYETIQISTRHGSTFVIASGMTDAPPLPLLHGAGTNSMMWANDISAYSQNHRVYAIDLPGEPGKSDSNRPAWDGSAFTEWVEDIYTGLGVKKASIVGISQGGWTALRFATVHPERVEKLVLLTPGGVVPDNLMFLLRVIRYNLMGKNGMRRMVQMLYGDVVIEEQLLDITAAFMTHTQPRIGKLPIFSDNELSCLTMPVLLLIGTKDALRDAEKVSARLMRFVPNLTVTKIAGGGHALLNTVDTITAFLTPPS